MSTFHQDQESKQAPSLTTASLMPIDPVAFQRRFTFLVLGLVLIWLLVEFLEKFAPILQPFFIACFIMYLILPLHMRLVNWGIPPVLTYVLILALTLLLFVGLGVYVYSNITGQSVERWEEYHQGVEKLVRRYCVAALPIDLPQRENFRLQDLLAADSKVNSLVRGWFRTAVGELFGLVTTCFVVFIYLVFLIAEKASLPARIRRAFDEPRALQVLTVIDNINRAITQYIGLKTFVSFLQGLLSFVVLALFGVDFALMWGLLIFLLNFIPYIGSLVGVASPIVLCFVQYPDQPWRGGTLTVLLLLIQRVLDNYIEPRLTGKKLGISPLLVLLSLAFWGWLWGIVGMILAVPLTVVGKIILENIVETKPIATMLSSE